MWKIDVRAADSKNILWREQFDTQKEALSFRRIFNKAGPLIASDPYEEEV